MIDEHSLLALVDLFGSLGVSGLLLLVVALFLRGDIIPAATLKALIAETVAETIRQLRHEEE